MTTIITRLYPDQAAADAAMASLLEIGQDKGTIRIITGQGSEETSNAMRAARVGAVAIAAYSKAMTGAQALLVVQAPFNPIGTARNAIRVLVTHPAMDVGLANEDVYLREYPAARVSDSILTKHPLLMSNPFRQMPHGRIFGNDPIIRGKSRTSAMRGGGFMSRFFWPMKLVSDAKPRTSAISGTWLFSSKLGLPLILKSWPSREDVPTILR